MRRRSSSVDFGPITLAFGERFLDGTYERDLPIPAYPSDAERLKQLVGRPRGMPTSGEIPQEVEQDVAAASDSGVSFNQNRNATVMQVLKQAFSVATKSNQIATSIALKLSSELMPNSELVVEMNKEGIYFDLYVGDESDINCLVGSLDAIAKEVGEFLMCPIRLRLFDIEKNCLFRASIWQLEYRR